MTPHSATPVYRFGPFRLDAADCRLFRDDAIVDLSPRLVDVLRLLVARPGELVTKEQLLETVWPDVIVTDNALARAISDIRHALGDSPANPVYIQTVTRRGYRFLGQVHASTRRPGAPDPRDAGDPRESGEAHETRDARTTPDTRDASEALEPYRAWIEGRLQLETLQVAAIPGAVASFERAVALAPQDALARAGLANARFMQFEMTRGENQPAYALLQQALADARAACGLDPSLGEAWATLSFVLVSTGESAEAAAAARRAIALQPGNWRHEFRLAHATWGEERLRAVDRTLGLFADFAFAHFVGAMVHIARRSFQAADALLRRGVAIQDRQAGRPATFPATGLHWLAGLVCLAQAQTPKPVPGQASEHAQSQAQGRAQEHAQPLANQQAQEKALAHFEQECRGEHGGVLYAIEFAVNAWDAIGWVRLERGDHEGALAAFREALARMPSHARSRLGERLALERLGRHDEAGRAASSVTQCLAQLTQGRRVSEAAIVSAADLAACGQIDAAATMLERLLVSAPPGFAGWTIPVEPLLAPLHGTAAFDRVLAILAERAA
jgi:DNA-binding winged helix-turn-helix (wHTH) protein